jgi:putative oxidoreductase
MQSRRGKEGSFMITLHIAEVLVSLIFIVGGGSTLLVPEPRAKQIARMHFPMAEVAVRINGLAMVVGGLLLALGLWAQVVAWVLIILLIPTTIFGHAFWIESSPKRQEQLSHFVKNLGILGGLLLVTLVAR